MTAPEERPWKRVLTLSLWLCFLTPVGLWMLWRDRTLSRTAKWRVIIYLFIFPTLLYFTATVWMANKTMQTLLP